MPLVMWTPECYLFLPCVANNRNDIGKGLGSDSELPVTRKSEYIITITALIELKQQQQCDPTKWI